MSPILEQEGIVLLDEGKEGFAFWGSLLECRKPWLVGGASMRRRLVAAVLVSIRHDCHPYPLSPFMVSHQGVRARNVTFFTADVLFLDLTPR